MSDNHVAIIMCALAPLPHRFWVVLRVRKCCLEGPDSIKASGDSSQPSEPPNSERRPEWWADGCEAPLVWKRPLTA
jgi:hypothetical protein